MKNKRLLSTYTHTLYTEYPRFRPLGIVSNAEFVSKPNFCVFRGVAKHDMLRLSPFASDEEKASVLFVSKNLLLHNNYFNLCCDHKNNIYCMYVYIIRSRWRYSRVRSLHACIHIWAHCCGRVFAVAVSNHLASVHGAAIHPCRHWRSVSRTVTSCCWWRTRCDMIAQD